MFRPDVEHLRGWYADSWRVYVWLGFAGRRYLARHVLVHLSWLHPDASQMWHFLPSRDYLWLVDATIAARLASDG